MSFDQKRGLYGTDESVGALTMVSGEQFKLDAESEGLVCADGSFTQLGYQRAMAELADESLKAQREHRKRRLPEFIMTLIVRGALTQIADLAEHMRMAGFHQNLIYGAIASSTAKAIELRQMVDGPDGDDPSIARPTSKYHSSGLPTASVHKRELFSMGSKRK